jgi:TonB family protein
VVQTLIVLAMLVALQPPPTTAAQTSWPPPGVLTMREVDTRPETVSRVQPKYTEQGIRRRLQGFVTIEMVVEADGTVGPTRIVASLDAESGMDVAAVESVKQWRFKPATKAGVPVRVVASAMVTFVLNGLPPPIRLPVGFEGSTDDPTGWSRSEVTAGGVRIQFAYPDTWQIRSLPSVVAMVASPKGELSAGVYPPSTMPRPLAYPMPVAELVRYSETMRTQFAQANRAELRGVGQAPLGSANWLWLELDLGDQARAWTFTTSVGTKAVSVVCTLVTPTLRMTEAERDAEIVAARSTCANLIRRLSFSAAQDRSH